MFVRRQPQFSMLPAIGFHDQPTVRTYEVRDVRPNPMLATKFATLQTPPTEQEPEKALGTAHFAAKLAGADSLHARKEAGSGKGSP